MEETRDVRRRVEPSLEALSTRELLALFERYFGRLDPRAKTRILEFCRARDGSDAWSAMDRLAA